MKKKLRVIQLLSVLFAVSGIGCDPSGDPSDADARLNDAGSDGPSPSGDAWAHDFGRADAQADGGTRDGALQDSGSTDTGVDLDSALDAGGDGAVLDAQRPDVAQDAAPDAANPAIDGAVDAAPGVGDANPDGAQPDLGLWPDAWVNPCSPGQMPEEERCNGLDDDCDGLVDEDFGVGQDCEALGRCGIGFVECDGELASRCSTAPGGSTSPAQAERCNGLDDDCDGESDEDELSVLCYSGPQETQGVGSCRAGFRRCIQGRLGLCEGENVPRGEICNGLDDDCDQAVDEDYVPVRVCGLGPCRLRATPSVCVDGVERPCQPGAPLETDQDCDGEDDDCDGIPDDGYIAVASCGLGRCAEEATSSACIAGQEVACRPGQASADDHLCNGVDDDCDGLVDEDYRPQADCGVGHCRSTAAPSRCQDGRETPCQPGTAAATDETCNDVDDDCDGVVDEDYQPVLTCGVGSCADDSTPSACILGTEIPCSSGVPALNDVTCDGRDDDCDGQADEDYVREIACGVGLCRAQSQPSSCVNGQETGCRPSAPLVGVDQTCDGVDEDCDGAVDEDVEGVASRLQVTSADGTSANASTVVSGIAEGFATLWTDNRAGSNALDLYFVRMSADGQRIGEDRRVTTLPLSETSPQLARHSTGYGIVFVYPGGEGTQGVYYQSLSVDGVPSASPPVRLTEYSPQTPKLAFDGTHFGVVWTDARGGTSALYYLRISEAGTPVCAAGPCLPIRLTNVEGVVSSPSLVSIPVVGFAVAYVVNQSGNTAVFTQIFNHAGQALWAPRQISMGEGNASSPSLIVGMDGFAVAWVDTRNVTNEIYLARLDATGARLAEHRLTEGAVGASSPSLVRDGSGYAIAYAERMLGNYEVSVVRADGSGVARAPIRVTATNTDSMVPTLVKHALGLGVTWHDAATGNQEIYFARGAFGCPTP